MKEEKSNLEDLNKLYEELNLYDVKTDLSQTYIFKNPVLNALFNGSKEKGGLPKSSVIEIAAESGTGKSTICLEIAREMCEQGKRVVYIDAEKGVNLSQLESMKLLKYYGDKNNSFIIYRNSDAGDLNEFIQKISDTKLVDLIILDSLGAVDSGIYDIGGTSADTPKVGGDTKSIKVLMKTINKKAIDNKTTFIVINHVADAIGSYIPQKVRLGGKSIEYLSDVIISLTRKSSDWEKNNLGKKIEFEVQKSRYGYGKCKIPFYIRYGRGIALIPTYEEVLDKIKDNNGNKILEQRGGGNGSLFIDGKEFKFRGQDQLNKLVIANWNYIKNLVTYKMFLPEEPEYNDFIDIDGPSNKVSPYSEYIQVYKSKKKEDIKRKEDLIYDLNLDELKDIEPIEVEDNSLVLDKGIDPTGQQYIISTKDNHLTLKYDTDKEVDLNGLSINNYNRLKDTLDQFIKSL